MTTRFVETEQNRTMLINFIEHLSAEVDRFNDELDQIVAKIRAYGGQEGTE